MCANMLTRRSAIAFEDEETVLSMETRLQMTLPYTPASNTQMTAEKQAHKATDRN